MTSPSPLDDPHGPSPWARSGNSLYRPHPKYGVQEIRVQPCQKGGAAFVTFRSGERFVGFSLDRDALSDLVDVLAKREDAVTERDPGPVAGAA